jgi:hypothetical protein
MATEGSCGEVQWLGVRGQILRCAQDDSRAFSRSDHASSENYVKRSRLKLALSSFCCCCAAILGSGGCYLEPFAEPIQVPSGYVPPNYVQTTYVPTTPGGVGVATTQRVIAPFPAATTPTVAPQPQMAIDDKARAQIIEVTQANVARRFGVDKAQQLNDYLCRSTRPSRRSSIRT